MTELMNKLLPQPRPSTSANGHEARAGSRSRFFAVLVCRHRLRDLPLVQQRLTLPGTDTYDISIDLTAVDGRTQAGQEAALDAGPRQLPDTL